MPKTVFSTVDAARDVIEIPAGQPFKTYSMIIKTDEEAAWSFTPIGEAYACEIQHPANALDNYGAEDLARFLITREEISDPEPEPAPEPVNEAAPESSPEPIPEP